MPPKRLSNRRACNECHRRHLKCDGLKPTCSPCSNNSRPCSDSAPAEFRHDHNPTVASRSNGIRKLGRQCRFRAHQNWVRVPRNLIFVRQDPASVSDDVASESGNESEPSILRPEREGALSRDRSPIVPEQPLQENTAAPFIEIPWDRPPPAPQSPDGAPVPLRGDRIHRPASIRSSSSGPALQLSPTTEHDAGVGLFLTQADIPHIGPAVSTPSLWPLSKESEGLLLRYFVTELSKWFDFCDKDRHFGTEVVQASSTNRTLLNAILAVSAKHMSLTRGFDPFAPDHYQQKCLETLIPAIHDHGVALDKTLFAATLILRLLYEMTDPLPGDVAPRRGHILDVHILTRSHEDFADCSLRRAALIVALRQETFLSFMTRSPPPPLAGYCEIDRTFCAADDYTWALRMVAHAEDVLTFCYGPAGRTLERWQSLDDYIDEWERHKPGSFAPIIYSKPADGFFPEICYANDCHVAGQQYADVCRILLAVHDPRIPSLGLDRSTVTRSLDERLKSLVRRLCGVAISNRQFPPATFVAGMAVAMCGDRFTDRCEQEQLLDILGHAEEHIGWSFLRARERLCNYWDI